MKRLSFLLAVLLALTVPCAFAERTLSIGGGEGALLITESGVQLTEYGDYVSIYSITGKGGEDEKELFAAFSADDFVTKSWFYDTGDGTGEVYTDEYQANLCALMNAQGVALTEFIYMDLQHDVKNGVVTFQGKDGTAGVMDESGKVLFSGEYGAILPVGKGAYLAVALDPDKKDSVGNPSSEGKLVTLDAQGTASDTGYIAEAYSLYTLRDGLAEVLVYDEKGDGWVYRYFSPDGKLAIDECFGYAEAFVDGLAVVTSVVNGSYGVINAQGEWVVPAEYSNISHAANGAIVAQKGDASVRFLSSDTFEEIASYEGAEGEYAYGEQVTDAILRVSSGSLSIFYDLSGKELFRADGMERSIFGYYAESDGNPQRLVSFSGEWPDFRYALVDLAGNTVSETYQELEPLRWFDGHGLYLFAEYKTKTETDETGETYNTIDDATYRVGLIDETGKVVLPAEYASLSYMTENRFWAEKDGEYGLIDLSGNWYFVTSEFSPSMVG